MIPSRFEYQRATSLEDAIARLEATKGSGKLLAGGHSLIPLMKLRLSEPEVLIDISQIADLVGIRDRGKTIEIGAATVHHVVATSTLLAERCPVMAEAASQIGDQQVRNLGTVGGSIAHADPAADYPAALLAIDAEICLVGPNGERVVKARDFFQDIFTVDLAPNEVVVCVRFGLCPASAYAKLHQRASRFAIVGVGAALDASNGTIQSVRLGLTGATSHAVRLTNVEATLSGKELSAENISAAVQDAGADLPAINSDIHAGEGYRRAMIPVLARRALDKARVLV